MLKKVMRMPEITNILPEITTFIGACIVNLHSEKYDTCPLND